MKANRLTAGRRRGFTLIEVALSVGIIGLAVLSLVGILGSTFQQVDEVMQTNRALACATKLVGALDNPRTIVSLQASDNTGTTSATVKYIHQDIAALDPTPATPATNFELVYRLMSAGLLTADKAVWLYVYERKVVVATDDFGVSAGTTTYNLWSNPSVMEVASASANCSNQFSAFAASARNVVGTPIRVRLRLSNLMVGQRHLIDTTTGEPSATTWTAASTLPASSDTYALAYLPLVAEFYAHDFSTDFNATTREDIPLLVQTIIVSR